MRLILFLILLFLEVSLITAQYQFELNLVEPKQNIVQDAIMENDSVFAMVLTIDTLKSSDLIILDQHGKLLNRVNISDIPFNAMIMIKKVGSDLYVVGRMKKDSCSSTIATGKFNFHSGAFTILSTVDFCEKNVQNLRLARKLDNDWFVEGYYVSPPFTTFSFILDMDTSFNLSPLFDSLHHERISIDFARKGYVIKDQNLCNFYDSNFNYRKQRYNFQDGSYKFLHQTHISFSKEYILESYAAAPDYENPGHYIRFVDSFLHIKNDAFIPLLSGDESGSYEPPSNGGIVATDAKYIWLAGNNMISSDPSNFNYFTIAKFDSTLNLVCNQYLGFDALYRIYGLKSTTDGGVLVYGMKHNDTYDPYIIKLGPNCELPSTSTTDPDHPIVAISAYPNPTVNSLTFDVRGFDPTTLRVEIFNAQGTTLFSRQDLSYEITVIDLPAGQYFYRIMKVDKILGVGGWVKG
jgi:hypothetical protein